MKRALPVVMLCGLSLLGLSAQQDDYTAEELFYQADEWFYVDVDYPEAAYVYKQVLKMEPDNAHVKFQIGMCYSNTIGQEDMAIPYFIEASENTTLKFKDSRYSIKKAPHHTWYHLADVYRKTNQLDKALEALDEFSSIRNFEKHYNIRITETAKKQIERAKIIKDAELNLRALYFNEPINSGNDDYSAVISANGKMMVWASHKTFYEAVYMSTRSDKDWTIPVEIATQIVSDGNLFPTGLSSDGTTLLLVNRPLGRRGDENIWYSQYDGMFWSPAQPLHGSINSKANESHASFSPDGDRIYFSSDRRGGEGGYDIWYSDRQGDGRWGEPLNMGSAINTSEDENFAYLAPGEGRFIFASKGHFNMGGYDIFRAELNSDGSFNTPTNIGYPINTTTDNTYYIPLNDGLSGLYSRYSNVGVGGFDLWYVEIQTEEGFVSNAMTVGLDTREGLSSKDFAIVVVDEESGEEIEVIYDSKSDSFKALSGEGKSYKVITYQQE